MNKRRLVCVWGERETKKCFASEESSPPPPTPSAIVEAAADLARRAELTRGNNEQNIQRLPALIDRKSLERQTNMKMPAAHAAHPPNQHESEILQGGARPATPQGRDSNSFKINILAELAKK